MVANTIKFLLNNELVKIENLDPNTTVLQYLREERFKSGTKEGCASGDCGACTVVLAELDPKKTGQLIYKSINSCITFVGNLHGKQLITVEDLKEGAQLHHAQQTIVDNHGSQCGFCTPGFVMSSFALHKQNNTPNRAEVLEALAGNLCRCTGYRSIIEAAITSSESAAEDSFAKHYQATVTALTALKKLSAPALTGNSHNYIAPKNIDELATELTNEPKSTLVAGGTDLALSVTQNLATIDKLVYVGNVAELTTIEETETEIIIGSALPYSEFIDTLHHYYPDLGEMIERIGSKQVRNTGTLGGNVGNASPIGDMPPALIALGATMTLHVQGQERTILVEDYFVDYKKTVLKPSEFIKSIQIPKPTAGQTLKLYKISKRIDDDISAVLAAFFIEQEVDGNGQKITNVRLAFGGMAAIPKRAPATEAILLGNSLTKALVAQAKEALTTDFQPMSDVRASDKYRMTVAQNLIEKCYLELQSANAREVIETRVVNYA
ncbi:xanthine dehydrogenase small subunit [Colwellia psychrerythraea]|uniref:Xanthine dehydrogenase, iron-sulfur binding subunit n=1 Tax=Colwellia psychrerythraea (strain 34H / ATCC BAA-681) TaxID=167879 RepID=Q47UL9_COLP3|nr:xanthine dehydrogenase small subunit [Colwellia psychrerythraea]AAZ28546.1 xanthine dehydrogenase, iron-sulfur binding subunit [Colwellia psychrerythraea 34H]